MTCFRKAFKELEREIDEDRNLSTLNVTPIADEVSYIDENMIVTTPYVE